jgi:hypothetical protein
MFEPGETSTIDFPGDNAKQLDATAVHEIAHGLMKYAINDFMAATEFWTDEDTKSGNAGAEAPPTPYGNKNAREDLSESVMMYYVYPSRGVAFSSDGHEVELLEIFAPTTLEDYRARIYEDPGAFVK